ncbi:imm11 family protein [Clostridium sporogenes]|uniref:imm11 family protein n=1 Tax=Clostridium sporogenes TaxID=1509 RepID=UPI0013D8207F|nr:DUF1629 domain-containing protein [Clostridium sporogenes]NFP90974.1 hypothetical protein [Clostridium sporogenes]
MKVWELDSDANNYDNVTLSNESDWDKLMAYGFHGKSIKDTWMPFCVEEIESIRKGDNPGFFGSSPVFSRKAVKVLKKYLDNNTEILPLMYRKKNHFSKEEYFVINVINLIDCIDYERAEVKRFKNSDEILRFIKYAFKSEVIKNEHIFKIPELKGRVFVSEEFRQRVMDKDLKGFKFELVWDSQLK